MSWKKHFTPVQTSMNSTGSYSPFSFNKGQGVGPAAANYSSHLPDVYVGSPNRVERYGQYNTMDSDSEVNAALDILAEFCSQKNKENNTPFKIEFSKAATNTEVQILGQYLKQWCKVQEFETRIFRIVRNTFKYGDQFFIRDPETKKWFHVDPSNVTKIIVNESDGKRPEQYIVKDINISYESLSATKINTSQAYGPGANSQGYQSLDNKGMTGRTPDQSSGRFGGDGSNETAIDAEHVIHLSMSEGLDQNFPFGNSLLESIFKVYKQKELLEDAIIIYRVQRAPERRVFYVDVGNMPANKAMGFVERVKNEIHQKRIPSKSGGGTTIMDAAYNPLSIMEDYFFAQTAEGRGSKVEVLPGGENLGQIDDLRYFTNKMLRALRVPSSYLPTGPDDGTASYVDGRVGTAFIQEYRFNQYCQRLQTVVGPTFDHEFKLFIKHRGINIDSSIFELTFVEPQSFSEYKEIEVHAARANVFGSLEGVEYLSRRFMLSKYLGLTEDEILENERLWMEENKSGTVPSSESEPGLGSVGVRSFDVDTGDDPDMSDLEADGSDGGTESPISGEENATTVPTPGGEI